MESHFIAVKRRPLADSAASKARHGQGKAPPEPPASPLFCTPRVPHKVDSRAPGGRASAASGSIAKGAGGASGSRRDPRMEVLETAFRKSGRAARKRHQRGASRGDAARAKAAAATTAALRGVPGLERYFAPASGTSAAAGAPPYASPVARKRRAEEAAAPASGDLAGEALLVDACVRSMVVLQAALTHAASSAEVAAAEVQRAALRDRLRALVGLPTSAATLGGAASAPGALATLHASRGVVAATATDELRRLEDALQRRAAGLQAQRLPTEQIRSDPHVIAISALKVEALRDLLPARDTPAAYDVGVVP